MGKCFVALIAVFVLAPVVVHATPIKCTPDQAADENMLQVERLDNGNLLFSGYITVPSPGYSAHIKRVDDRFFLSVNSPPDGLMTSQVISTLTIDQEMVAPKVSLPLEITVKKLYGWGPIKFVCG